MNTIFKLMKKDFLSFNLFQIRYIFIIIISIGYSIFLPSFVPLACYMLTFLVVYNIFFNEFASKGEYLTYSLPVSTKYFTISKYLFSFLFVAITSITLASLNFISIALNKEVIFNFQNTLLLTSTLSLSMLAISIPLILKFGYKNFNLINLSMMLLFGFGGTYLFELFEKSIVTNFDKTILIGSLLSLILYLISLIVSILITNKKEILN
ncbi:MAG: ABC-2 transporter permease [Sarcina sp.]